MVRESTLAAGGVVAAMGVVSAIAYPEMPERMVTHWNAAGEPNGSMGRTLGLVALPAITAATVALLQALPGVDPRDGIQQFRAAYDAFVVLLALFLGYVHVLVVAVNAGYSVSVSTAVLPAVGILVYGAGVALDRAEQNWFLGIRTPWTLESEEVWERTNRLGARLFRVAGVVTALGVFAGEWAVYFAVGPVAVTAVVTTLYSLYAYRGFENTQPRRE